MSQPRIKPVRNPYKLQPVATAAVKQNNVPAEAPLKPALEFGIGDQIEHTFYHHSLFTILLPVIVRDIVSDAHYSSGWKVGVETTDGIKYLDSRYFRKASGA
jgi:hypothetical protein